MHPLANHRRAIPKLLETLGTLVSTVATNLRRTNPSLLGTVAMFQE